MSLPENSIEKQFSKVHLMEKVHEDIQVAVSWDLIDASTSQYAKSLQEYDISEIIKTFISRFGKNKIVHSLPKPGNFDIKDTSLNFVAFLNYLEDLKVKNKSVKRSSQVEQDELKNKCQNMVDYLRYGKHSNSEKQFIGWDASIKSARKAKKTVFLGIISVDIPVIKKTGKYECSGTQHYVSFSYDIILNELLLFDSASRDPLKDETEVALMLKYTFEAIMGSDIKIVSMRYRNVLQPGAGDKSEEDEKSYNNQNVFCHTWSMWYCLVVICFYNTPLHEDALKFLKKLSHRNPLLNLAMIKRFAGWVSLFITEEDNEGEILKFPAMAYERARTDIRKHEVLTKYLIQKHPFIGLNYIYNFKTKRFITVEALCYKRKVKLDIDILEKMNKININDFIDKSKILRCSVGNFLNELTNRCNKVRVLTF
jgi:hypothetical protein